MRGKRAQNTVVDGFVTRRDMEYDVDEIDQMGLVFIRGTEPFCDIDIDVKENTDWLFDIPDWNLDNEELVIRLREFLKSIKIDYLGIVEYAQLAEEFLSNGKDYELADRLEFEKSMWLDGVGELLSIGRAGLFEFSEVKEKGIISDADALRKFRLMDLLIGGVLRRWFMVRDLEVRVVEWLETTYPEGVRSDEYLKFKVERWKKCWQKISSSQQKALRKEYS